MNQKKYVNLVIVPVNFVEGVVFITAKNKFKLEGWSSLKPYSIGIRRGTKFAEIGTKGMHVEAVTSNKQMFLKLIKGRSDVVVTSRVEGLFELKKLKIKEDHIMEPPLEILKLYHYLNNKHITLIPEILKVLKRMKRDGRITKIHQKAIKELLKD
ncbi:MAG: amino acid ABC transporter substrate-binding protein [Proteobacteria bacterium]|nr:amino acid ABC transporter substrate-binding protein [Pseudomonadota bacterium]